MALAEGKHKLEFLVSEASGNRSREAITLKAGAALAAGSVLGKIKHGAATPAAAETNAAGTGVIAAATTGKNTQAGVYTATCILAATNGGTFELTDPNGKVIGYPVAKVAFLSDELGFTITDGNTDFSVGESFTITVAATDAGKYLLIDPEGTTGIEVACAVLAEAAGAAGADAATWAIVRDAEVNNDELGYSDADATEIAAIKAQLANVGIIVREGI